MAEYFIWFDVAENRATREHCSSPADNERVPKALQDTGTVVAWLAAAPERIASTTAGIEAEALRQSPGPEEWPAVDLLAHLRSCADVWGGCIARILVEDNPRIRATNPRAWIETTDYRELAFETSLSAYTAQRDQLIETLMALAPGQWTREATVTGAGKTLVRSLHFYADWLVSHERTHLKQMERIVATLKGERESSHTGKSNG